VEARQVFKQLNHLSGHVFNIDSIDVSINTSIVQNFRESDLSGSTAFVLSLSPLEVDIAPSIALKDVLEREVVQVGTSDYETSQQVASASASMTKLLGSYPKGIPRIDRDSLQHCAIDDAVNTVRLTGSLLENLAGIDLESSFQKGFPPRTVWPPDGFNIRLMSIDTYVTSSLPVNTC
jgi:hypothetical protein